MSPYSTTCPIVHGAFFASLDIGSDTLTGVNDSVYQPPFTVTGKLDEVTLSVDRPRLSLDDIKKLQQAQRTVAKARA